MGYTYKLDRYEEGNEYYSTSGPGPTIRISPLSEKMWESQSSTFNQHPLKEWWDNYGRYGDYPIEPNAAGIEAMDWIETLGLDVESHGEDFDMVASQEPVQEKLTAPQKRSILD